MDNKRWSENENRRLAALEAHQILDSEPERAFDEITRVAAKVFDVPAAFISLVSRERQWLKSKVGIEICETPRDVSFCTHAIETSGLLLIEDAQLDPRFKNNPFVLESPYIRFYVGAVVKDRQGYHLGTLCLIDQKPRKLTSGQIELLQLMADNVASLIELRSNLRASEVARAQLRLFERSLEACQSGITVCDFSQPDRPLIAVNKGFEKLTGYSKEEALGKNCRFLQGVNSDPSAVSKIRNALELKESCDVLIKNTRKDGSEFWNELYLSPVFDDSGCLTHYIGIQNDVTERIESKRVIEAQQQSLIYSSRLSALGEMAAGIAHEINNPLAVIHVYARRIRDASRSGNEVSPEDLGKAADKIENTVMKIAKIVKSLRSFARDGQSERVEAVDAQVVVDEALEICRERMRNQGVTLEFDWPSNSITLSCRPTQIAQVLINLLNNALRAVTGVKQKWIRISVREADEVIWISVSDSGPGVPKRIAHKIFEPFFTTADVGQGTGLGLSISRGIVESHGGRLWLDQEKSNTTFVLSLPNKKRA